ncbi:MAG: alpha/beta fold hydrolase [Kamptonema sp. SIO4C4]|nr:alpha/beta fold hydrolase [Kamptonema sp. SIO4C4]
MNKLVLSRYPHLTPTSTVSPSRLHDWLSFVRFPLFSLALLCCWGVAQPTHAAEQVTLRLGFVEKTVQLDDLEEFAETGEISASLKLFSPLLTPELREVLSSYLALEPEIVDSFLEELLNSPDGQRLMEQLQEALPNSSITEFQAALSLALAQTDSLSILSVLRSHPQDTIVIDMRPAASIALKLHSYLIQGKMLAPILERELAVSEDELATLNVSFDPSQRGKQQVRQRSVILRDKQRDSRNDGQGQDRKIPVDLYYAADTRGPLIVMSHGFAADRKFMNYLAEHLASHGFSVLSIEHPGNSINTLVSMTLEFNPSKLLSASEFIDRPQDVSFVLDKLDELRQDWSYLYEKFNTDEVVVIGHSLGGSTALALAGGTLNFREVREFCQQQTPVGRSPADWLQCSAATLPQSKVQLRDERVVSAIALNPLIGQLFGESGLDTVETPVMLLSSSGDVITPALDHQLRPFQDISEEKYLVAIAGATHMSVTDLGHIGGDLGQGTLSREVMGEEAKPVRRLVRGLSLAFVEQETEQARIYRPFLTATYVQALSTPELSMRLTRDFSGSMRTWLGVVESSHQAFFEPEAQETRSAFQFVEDGMTYLQQMFQQPNYCQGQLNQIFTSLLSNEPA